MTTKRLLVLQTGINTVTMLVENKKVQLVVIARDMDPIGLVLFLPALSSKMGVPYCIIKGKARLGHLAHLRLQHCGLHTGQLGDKGALTKLLEAIRTHNNEICCHWGGNVLDPSPSWRRPRTSHWPRSWDEHVAGSFLHNDDDDNNNNDKACLKKKKQRSHGD